MRELRCLVSVTLSVTTPLVIFFQVNKTLPYLVSNVVELLDLEDNQEEEGKLATNSLCISLHLLDVVMMVPSTLGNSLNAPKNFLCFGYHFFDLLVRSHSLLANLNIPSHRAT